MNTVARFIESHPLIVAGVLLGLWLISNWTKDYGRAQQ